MSTTPHDDLVRAILSHPEHAAGELQYLLPPEVTARMDWTTLELVPGNFVEETLQKSYSDLLFRVKLGGHPAFAYLLFEHQSSPNRFMPFRLLKYTVRFWDTWMEDHPEATHLPAVIPMLLCHTPGGWTVATRFEDLLDIDSETRALILDFVPRFRILVDDLTVQSDDSLRVRAMSAVARVALWCLKTARDATALLDGMRLWSSLFQEAHTSRNGAAAIRSIWTYMFCVHEERTLLELKALLDEEQKKEMSLADHLERKGIEKGRKEGERTLLERLLQRRFGPLPEGALDRIRQAEASDLERWADRVLTAATLAEVLAAP